MKISIGFRWFDLWIGVYIDRNNRAVYVCPLPTIVIKFQLEKRADPGICRDCQHVWEAHAQSLLALTAATNCAIPGCGCTRFVKPDNLS